MIDSRHIQDDFGNSIPMLDAYGNLSVQAIMLYAEDKLTEADRKAVDDFAANDEMSLDALEGYSLLPQTAKTRMVLGSLNTDIQKTTGSVALPIQMQSQAPFNYRKLAAVITLLIVVGGGTFWASKFFIGKELAEDITLVNSNDSIDSETEISPPGNQSDFKVEEALESVKAKKVATDELQPEKDNASKLTGSPETTSLKSLEKIPASTGAIVDENKRQEAAKTANADLKDADRSEDVASKTKPSSADVNVAQEQREQLNAGVTNLSENQKNTDKKAKDSLAKEAESRVTAGRMRESAKAEMQSNKYDSAYEPTGSPAIVQQAINTTELSAKFPGGDVAMYKFLEKKKVYPEALRAQNVSGTVSVWFDIEMDGRVTNARIKSGENGMLTEDALRVVRSMPQWKAAQNAEGEPIKSSRTVVIKYGQE